jgi:hypothetical protein
VQVNSGKASATYSCVTTLSPAPVTNSGHTACLCVADSDCPSGVCANASNQCTGTCSGTGAGGTYDSADCQLLTSH